MRRLLLGGTIAILSFAAQAEEVVTLKVGPGRDIVEGYCGACHSLDYLRINAGFLNRKGWESEVDKRRRCKDYRRLSDGELRHRRVRSMRWDAWSTCWAQKLRMARFDHRGLSMPRPCFCFCLDRGCIPNAVVRGHQPPSWPRPIALRCSHDRSREC